MLLNRERQRKEFVSGSFHTTQTPEEFGNAALFQGSSRLSLPSTLIGHTNTELFENA